MLGQTVKSAARHILMISLILMAMGSLTFNDVSYGNIVEVSGFVDAKGIIHATYISLKADVF